MELVERTYNILIAPGSIIIAGHSLQLLEGTQHKFYNYSNLQIWYSVCTIQ